jgi:hypothetical protein
MNKVIDNNKDPSERKVSTFSKGEESMYKAEMKLIK